MSVAARRIPVCEPVLSGNELSYATQAISSTWISSGGEFLKRFEAQFAGYIGTKHGISTVNGTTALHLALRAAGIGPGDEVIVPDFTMIAPVAAICYCGAQPVFVDADPETWTLSPSQVEAKITKKTKAILVVHIYGHPADMGELQRIAKAYKLLLIEDAAEAHGAEYKGKRCGSLSDISAFSFYANKIITTGEGGMVLTDSDVYADQSRYFKNLCFPLNGPRSYHHNDIGFNYRMTNVQAAIGLAQLEQIDQFVEARRRNAALYTEQLRGCTQLQLPAEKSWAKNCYWMYGIVLDPKANVDRSTVMGKLQEAGIETRAFFEPMHAQRGLVQYGADCKDSYPVTEFLGKNGFYLPSSTSLKAEDISYVSEQLLRCLR